MKINERTAETFCTSCIREFMESAEFNKYADTHTWDSLIRGLIVGLPYCNLEYENFEEYVYDITCDNLLDGDYRIGTVLNCIRYQDELPREPFTDSTKPVNVALAESIRMYLVSGVREFILNKWREKYVDAAATAIVR